MSAKGRYDLERLSGKPTPLKLMARGQGVDVYLGAGWAKGVVQESTTERCVVWMTQGQRCITVYDKRNIRRHSQ
ncbi:hypothetical protein [Vulcanococcus sp.]|uniref:hypothetical protein n=1 Tax=Vulcanococcus sp. TaxID=2856995 RepID=UPI003C024C70